MHNNLFSSYREKIGLELVDLDLGVSSFTQWNNIRPFYLTHVLGNSKHLHEKQETVKYYIHFRYYF